MLQFLQISQIVICALLIALILIQNKNISLNLSSMWGWMGPITKRWPEKALHNTTIALSILFALNSLLIFFLG